ncbi:MAG: 5-dehydro-2-deoxygluconokinase [Trueperaceae bacterium]|nr:5-dehydro-2-deoxygluconokinase [Trueperaceae bacterium]
MSQERASDDTLDLLTMGRSSIDLYANDVGVPFERINSFNAYVGGSPTNIAVGARRLGLASAVLTGVGEDKVGDFITTFLNDEKVDTRQVVRKPGTRSTAVLLGIEPDGRFPLVFYREAAPDVQLSIDDVLAAQVERFRALEISGTGLAKPPQSTATLFAAERAQAAGRPVFLDLDFRADQWYDPRAFGRMVRAALPLVTVAIGTVEEVHAAMLRDPAALRVEHQQISAPEISGDLDADVRDLLAVPSGPEALVVKRGDEGARIYLRSGEVIEAPGFPAEVVNVLGAGDAFAAGLIYGRLQGWDWYASARMGNACGAIVVGRHACANSMGTLDEVMALADAHGGLH